MHPRYDETVRQVTAWARENSGIQGVLIIGSQARSAMVSDQWSDLDLMVLVDDPAELTGEHTWFERFGEVVCFFAEIVPLHFTTWNWYVRRVLYADDRDVDFSILPHQHLDEVLAVNKDIIEKGYRVIYDRHPGELEAKVCALLGGDRKEPARAPAEQELDGVVSELLYHVIWAFKKIKRQELWVAVGCINVHMRNLLLRLIEAYNVSVSQQPDPLMYSGRFLERRTDPEILAKLAGCFTRYDEKEAVEALRKYIDITETLWKALCERNGYAFDERRFERIKQMYEVLYF